VCETYHTEVSRPVASKKQLAHSHCLKGDMHEMDIATTDSLKEELINQNPEFRELAREHHKYEERLSELSALTYPSDEEQLEEITLKKKKLALKDQMYSMMLQYKKAQSMSH
jgi:uncharacterized protein YdcH (DUF465 family)